jgi:hypothetical protein
MSNSQNQNSSQQSDTSSNTQSSTNIESSPPTPIPQPREVIFTPDDMATSQFNEGSKNIQNL